MENHSYADRLSFLLNKTGGDLAGNPLPSMDIVARLEGGKEIDALIASVRRQNHHPTTLFACSAPPLGERDVERLQDELGKVRVISVFLSEDLACQKVIDSARGDYLAFWNAGDLYGANYLKDYALATNYSKGERLFGKHDFFAIEERNRVPVLQNAGNEFTKVFSIATGSLVVGKEVVTEELFRQALAGGNHLKMGKKILSLDRYNYIQIGSRMTNLVNLLEMVEV